MTEYLNEDVCVQSTVVLSGTRMNKDHCLNRPCFVYNMSHTNSWKKEKKRDKLLPHFCSISLLSYSYSVHRCTHYVPLLFCIFVPFSLPLFSLHSPQQHAYIHRHIYVCIYIPVELKADQQLFFPTGISNKNRIVSFQ